MEQNVLQSEHTWNEFSRFTNYLLTAFILEKRADGFKVSVVGCTELVPVRDTASCLIGVIYLDREVIPIIDLRIKFGLDATKINNGACLLLTNYKRKTKKNKIGIIFDNILDVFNITKLNKKNINRKDTNNCEKFDFHTVDSSDLHLILENIDQILCGIDFDSFEKIV